MPYSNIKPFLSIFLIFSCSLTAQAQSYFYTTIKAPLAEFIVSAINGGSENRVADADDQTEGIGFTTGYAFKIEPNFFNEVGFDYLALNKAVRTSYKNETRLENTNSVFAFQTKPTYRPSISADDDVFLTVGMSINYQKIYSEGNFNSGKSSSYSADKKQGNWFVNTQPNLGIEFIGDRKIGYRFGVSYARYNWTKVENRLFYKNAPDLVAEPHITSNLFFSGGFIF